MRTPRWVHDLKCSFNGTSVGPLWGPLPGPKQSSQLGRQGATPLVTAAARGHGEVLQQLINGGPLVVHLKTSVRRSKGGHTVWTSVEQLGVFGKGGLCERGSSGAGGDSSDPFWETVFPPKDSNADDLHIDVFGLACVPRTSPFTGVERGSHCMVTLSLSRPRGEGDIFLRGGFRFQVVYCPLRMRFPPRDSHRSDGSVLT